METDQEVEKEVILSLTYDNGVVAAVYYDLDTLELSVSIINI
jgi:small ligand-binding sensory domain FIST